MKNNCAAKILITSPSFNVNENIGGISNFTKLLIENNHLIKYVLFVRGKKDFERRGFIWFIRQPFVLLNFITIIISKKGIKIAHINMPLESIGIVRDSLLIIIAACFRKKIILHFHGGNYNLNNKIPFFLNIFLKISIILAHKIITLGKKEQEFLIEHFNMDIGDIIFIPNSVKIPTSSLLKSKSLLRILYLGRIDKNKGLKEITLALEQLKNKVKFQFIIAGDGPDKDDFIGDCKRRIPDNYHYMGIISGEKKEMVLDETNIFLMPSYYEGLPYALLEAMAYKLVPIVTPVGSIPEIVEDGKNGFLVPVYNYKAIINSIIELDANPKKFEEMSQNAYETIKSDYSLSSYLNKINAVYSNLYPKILNIKKM
jgi:glycosyltransferase involved in cell wall biosynthesis